ncbi:BTAD domain-containing putative transcriptional regulator [Sphaerisporangium sp. NPDC049003]|uniref:AfsR/SARP family transcriptional regulator n=1 Tax=Sphaerisporangium sp. NPDC049003 TaxID=3364517 RepID=UPI00371ADFE1
MLFRVLGPLSVSDHDGNLIDISRRKNRGLLALLLLHANVAVSQSYLVEHLWDGRPPKSADSNLKTYIFQLRRLLSSTHLPEPRIVTSRNGYALTVGHEDLDAAAFDLLVAEGRRRLADGDPRQAYELLEKALGLWRGDPLHGIDLAGDLAPWAGRLREEHVSATEDFFDVKLRLGRNWELIGRLRAWTSAHTLRERPHGQLMLALHRSGRHAEALDVYRNLRHALVTHVGTEPGADVRDLHQRILRDDPALLPENGNREFWRSPRDLAHDSYHRCARR